MDLKGRGECICCGHRGAPGDPLTATPIARSNGERGVLTTCSSTVACNTRSRENRLALRVIATRRLPGVKVGA
jgi:hypothetical protein